uniref:Phosphatidylinositol-specific phospholipase C n=1 Tax=Podospora anserina (strain S / ATCC MYA-4624 / DSM 980 / FGSC 10383) TaxID=515849 RepID=A0A090CCG3_PODAN|nr:Putative phosphatidylinositol-specific phospholipase C [Podospora anserina S mat+]
MPSKGVQVFTYIGVPDISIELSVPKQTITRRDQGFWSGTLEVEARNIDSFFNKKGRFTFKVFHRGNQITEQWIDVNALTGNASGGTMESIAETPSIFHDNFIISYGLYEAGPGHEPLPNQHQCYVTVTQNYTNWITNLAPPGSDFEKKPFHRLVLPSAHDVGMNSMESSAALLRKVGGAVVSTMLTRTDDKVCRVVDKLSGYPIELIAPNIIYSLSITQKDSLESMLRIGARYFEFRPARLHSSIRGRDALPDKLYFMHSAIPGMGYDTFLEGIVKFLRANKNEIIVVQLRWDGVPFDCAHPSSEEKKQYLEKAIRDHAGGEINVGNLDDMKHRTISELRRDKKRLLMLDSVDTLSTYTDDGNATINGQSIVDAFPRVLEDRGAQRRAGFVLIQCQATATNIQKALLHSIKDAGVTTSVLLATKGLCDHKTLPWCRDNVVDRCELGKTVVLMNDWLDGATVDVAVGLSRRRLAK